MAHERIKLEEDCAILKNRIIDLAAWLKEILANPTKEELFNFGTQYNGVMYRKENKEDKESKAVSMRGRFIELSPEFVEIKSIYRDLIRCFPRSSKAISDPKVLTELRDNANPKLDLIITNAQEKIKSLNEKREKKFADCKTKLILEAKELHREFNPKKSHEDRKIKMSAFIERFEKELSYTDTRSLMRLQSDIYAHITTYIMNKNKQSTFGYTQQNFENEKPRYHYATFLRKMRDHLKTLGFWLKDNPVLGYVAEAKVEDKKSHSSRF